MQYKQEFLDDIRGSVENLIQDHYSEVHPIRSVYDWEMDWDAYGNLEEIGMLNIFTARDKGTLVGYLCVIRAPNLHSKGSVLACDDGFYVAKSHRGKAVAKDLVRFAEGCLKEDGIEVFHLVGTKENPINSFVEPMGYREVETKFQKVL